MLTANALTQCDRVRLTVKSRRQALWRDITVRRPLVHCYWVDAEGRADDAPFAVMPLSAIARLLARHGFAWVPQSDGLWERVA